MKRKVMVKYNISELKLFETNEIEPDMLSPGFIEYVRRSSYDRLLVWFSKHYLLKIIALVLLVAAIGFFLANLYWVSYSVAFLSLVSLLAALYFYNLWKNNYPLVESLCAFAASMVQQKQEEFQTKTINNTK